MSIIRKFKNKKGQSLVETALVLPIILLILMGIVDFGMMFNNYLTISNAAREGARSAAVGATNEQIDSVIEKVTATLDQTKIDKDYSPPVEERYKGTEVTVTVTYRYKLLTPLIGKLFSGPINLTATAVMRIE